MQFIVDCIDPNLSSGPDIKCSQLPDIGWTKQPGKFHVKLIVDQEIKETVVAPRSNAPLWNETFDL